MKTVLTNSDDVFYFCHPTQTSACSVTVLRCLCNLYTVLIPVFIWCVVKGNSSGIIHTIKHLEVFFMNLDIIEVTTISLEENPVQWSSVS